MSVTERTEHQQQYSDDELIELLQEVARKTGEPVTQRDLLLLDGYPDVSTYERRFGSWNRAKVRAGLKTVGRGKAPRQPGYTDEELIAMLQELAAETDGPVRKADVAAIPEYPSPSTFGRRFGTWTEAKHKAGIK